jgi:uncharacterized protein YggT (Ycf19 family)
MIDAILQLFTLIIFFDVIMSYVPDLQRYEWARTLHKIADAPQKPIRDLMPRDLPLDPSPMIVIFIIQIVRHFL